MPENENQAPDNRRVRSSYKRRRSKKKRQQLARSLQIVGLIGLIAAGLAYVTYQIFRPDEVNTAEAITSVEFDPIEEYDTILDKGTADQKLILLKELIAQPQAGAGLPVLADLYKKIVATASELVDEKELSEKDRTYAATKKLDSIWKLYLLNLQNDVFDPLLCDQFRNTSDKFIKSENDTLRKQAFIGKLRYLTGETITQRNKNIDHVCDTVGESLDAFPEDLEIIDSIRRAHAQLINVDREYATAVGNAVEPFKSKIDSDDFRLLVRQLNDLNLLYELGIGNLPSISDLNTTVEDFNVRLTKLANAPEIGELVYQQLSNGIAFLEGRRYNQEALELGQVIQQRSVDQAIPDLATIAKKMGDTCVQRNSLVNSRWQFDETDFQNQPIDDGKFAGAVTLIVMYPQNNPQTAQFLKTMQSLERAFQGRNVRMIYMAVTKSVAEGGQLDVSVAKNNVLLATSLEKPNKYLQQCPTTRLPYLILIDKSGNVSSINVPLKALKTRIESLL